MSATDDDLRTAPGQEPSDDLVRPARRVPLPSFEWVLVGLIVIAAALSAFSIWQATTFAEEAADTQNQERAAEARRLERLTEFNVQVDSDLRLAVQYCAALTEQQWALVDVFDGAEDAETRVLSSTSRRVQLVSSLFQGSVPADCSTDSVDELVRSDFELNEARRSDSGLTDPARLARNADRLGASEAWLMGAGVVFAAALLLLALADAASHRRQDEAGGQDRRRWWPLIWIGVAAIPMIGGLTVLVGHVELEGGDVVWVGGVLLLGLVISLPFTVRLARRASSWAMGLPLVRSVTWWRDRPLAWWAEGAGAATLVVFAATALGFSLSAIQERSDEAQADRLSSEAQSATSIFQQAAMRDLGMVASLVELNAHTQGLPESVSPVMREMEEHAREDLEAVAARTDDIRCADAAVASKSTPEELLARAEVDQSAYRNHVLTSLRPGIRCTALADAIRERAASWGDLRATFTVALVILGLAGFLVGAAGDSDRTRRPAEWLLRVGIGGALVGALVAGVAAWGLGAGGSDIPGDDALERYADHSSAGRVALLSGACDEAREEISAAVDAYQANAVAHADLAEAFACSGSATDVLTSDLPQLAEYMSALESARERGLADSRVLGGLGWAHFLRGTDGGGDPSDDAADPAADLASAVSFTDEALRLFEADARADTGFAPMAHILRVNAAVTRLAAGMDALPAYQRALDCLDGDVACPGGEISDPGLRATFLLSALADLELLSGDVESHDEIRELLISEYHALPAGDPVLRGVRDAELLVFPREVQLSGSNVGRGDEAIIIWYYRPHDAEPWSVLLGPSLRTHAPGRPFTRPIQSLAPLPEGEYRADVYDHGHLIARVDDGRREDAEVTVLHTVPDLGLALALPDGWERKLDFSDPDRTAAFGPVDDHPYIILERREGFELPDSNDLTAELDAWVAEFFPGEGDLDGAETLTEPYLLDLSNPVKRLYPEVRWRAAAAFSSYGASEACPGTLMLALYSDDAIGYELIDSVVFTREGQDPVEIRTLQGDYESSTYGFAVHIPDGWDAIESPGERGGTGSQFVATECGSGANFRVGVEPVSGLSLAEYFDLNFDPIRDFEGFELLERESIELPSGVPAERVTYRWSADRDVLQIQTYAISGSTGYFATATVAVDDLEEMRGPFEEIVASFDIVRGATSTSSRTDGG